METKTANDRGESLLRRVLRDLDGAARNGALLNDLLQQFQQGYPANNVLRLVTSEEPEVVRAGAWLLSEIGTPICNLLHEIDFLFDSSDERVRFFVIDCVLLCATLNDGQLVLRVAESLDDPSPAVRWKALDAIIRLRTEQVEAAQHWSEANKPSPGISNGFAMLRKATPDAVAKINVEPTSCSVEKKIAFAAAVRASCSHAQLQEIARKLGDRDIDEFLEDFNH